MIKRCVHRVVTCGNILIVVNNTYTKIKRLGDGKMGLFASKIGIGVLAGSFSLGAAGLLFSGSETLQNASNFVKDAGNRLVQFEDNENSLLNKISLVKTDANSKIDTANGIIAENKKAITDLKSQIDTLKTEKTALEEQVKNLQAEIATLQADLEKSNSDLASTRAALDEKTKQYDAKVVELNAANKKIKELNDLLHWAYTKSKEADKHVLELEGELQQANQEVDAHGKVVDETKAKTEGAQPVSKEEVDAIGTELNAVDTQK